jgi:hypothetical protein
MGESFIISRDRRSEMHSLVSQGMLRTPDIIYADHLQMFQYVPPNAPCPVLLDEHNVEWRIIERMQAQARAGRRGVLPPWSGPSLNHGNLAPAARRIWCSP